MKQNDAGSWLQLEGAVCVVTGAASGIGAAIAEGLCQQGARVALLDKNPTNLTLQAQSFSDAGYAVLPVVCDISSEAETLRAANLVRNHWGHCGVLVNNAGLLRSNSLDDISLDDWNLVLSVNLTGYLLCARAFQADMKALGGGSIVHVASVSGHFPQTHSGAYSASKAGVLLLSRQMAVEWGSLGIRSNAICPGMIRTPLSAKFYEEPGFEARRAAVTASGRIGEPQDIANVAMFLASPRSAYVNGAEMMVDGGMSSMLMDMVPRPGYNQTAQV